MKQPGIWRVGAQLSRRVLILAACAAVGLNSPPTVRSQDETLPKAEVILEKFVEVTGGKAAYDKVYNQIVKGTIEFTAMGVKGSMTIYLAEPNKSYTVVDLAGVGKIEEGTDGQVAWTQSAMQGPRVKEGDERATALRHAIFNSQKKWREIFKKVETVGIEKVDDQSQYKVVLTPHEGGPETHYYDSKTNLLVRSSMILKSPMGEIPVEGSLGDYREAQGILVPHSIRQKALNQELHITVESVQANVDLPKDRFDLPPDIKALVDKSKAPAKP